MLQNAKVLPRFNRSACVLTKTPISYSQPEWLQWNGRSTWLPAAVIFHFIQQLVSGDKMAVTMKTLWVLLLLNGSFVFAFFCC